MLTPLLTSPTPPERSACDASRVRAYTLTVEHLTKRYNDVTAIDGVSLCVERGRFVTLLGPSGSGKTTLLMAIAGFVTPTAGQILLDDAPITHLPPERRQFGMVFQGYALFPHLSVADNVAFPLKVRRRPRAEITERVCAALDQVRLSSLGERLPRQLSGGQQQRAALARALVFDPHLLLLDEPLSALDKNLRAELQGELKDLHQRVGLTFIYVTHDQQEALSMSDEIAILRNGRLVQQGAPRALYERPASRFAAGFLGRSNFVEGRVEHAAQDGFTYRAGGALLRQSGTTPDRQVLIALRPEKLRLLDAEAEADNRLSGHVSACLYLGDDYALTVTVDGIGPLTVAAPAWRAEPPRIGALATIGWDNDAGVPVAED